MSPVPKWRVSYLTLVYLIFPLPQNLHTGYSKTFTITLKLNKAKKKKKQKQSQVLTKQPSQPYLTYLLQAPRHASVPKYRRVLYLTNKLNFTISFLQSGCDFSSSQPQLTLLTKTLHIYNQPPPTPTPTPTPATTPPPRPR